MSGLVTFARKVVVRPYSPTMLAAFMNEDQQPRYELRRATLEDLPELKGLWLLGRLPGEELEKRFTEFQIAVDGAGSLRAAVGLHIEKSQGLIHSEAFADYAEAVEIRPLVWDRIISVAKNHGLVRLWALPTNSFFRQQGMTEVDPARRVTLPASFGNPNADWLSLKLRDDLPAVFAPEKEFELFAADQKESTERMIKQAQVFKLLAYLLLAFALAGLGALAFFAFKRAPRPKR